MRARLKRYRPSPAMAVALLALVVALGATAEGAVIITSNSQVASGTISGSFPPPGDHANLIAGSVGGADLHAASIDQTKLAASSVTTGKIKDGTITRADIATTALGADAFGIVGANAALTTGRNVVAVNSPGTGIYCIQLAAGLPTGVVTASPDFAHDDTFIGVNTSKAEVEVDTNGGDCSGLPAQEVEVRTLERTVSSGSIVETPQGEGFTFVVG